MGTNDRLKSIDRFRIKIVASSNSLSESRGGRVEEGSRYIGRRGRLYTIVIIRDTCSLFRQAVRIISFLLSRLTFSGRSLRLRASKG